ncbi:TadE/TadG family type IV pilus assembly protein [Hoeflea sp. AS16]|uniref:vWA domain-containing protein n=1 Tax=Hoeflea sp. AS16 TaxID=3135779 RepID=UPI00317354FD
MMKKIADLLRNKNGNFAMLAGLTIPVVFIAGSLAVDTTNAMSMKVRLQNAVDSAALATSTRLAQEEDLSLEDAKAFAVTFLQGQVEEDMPVFTDMSVKPTVEITTAEDNGATIWRVAISMTGTQALTPMARLMGKDSISVGVLGKSESASGTTQGAFSMALVLDRSGSMDWKLDGQRKIDVLKSAVDGLLTQIETADPSRTYVRIGASSYSTYMTGSQKLTWKPSKTRDFVNALPASGGTDSTQAFSWAFDSVSATKELNKHMDKNGQEPVRYIVFMTDGDNNYSSADSSTKILCDKAKGEGVQVYTVAFAAPTRGKELLSYCATSSAHFFDARSSVDLVAAFKSIGEQASQVASRLTQ